jgi:glycosyltransferase involved in cell wall biosynthesis
MPVDVSVVVPFFNPGPDIDECLASLLDQTLATDRYDIVLVDDGSTDGSAGRVDEWVARHPEHASVLHIPASGGPGRPRNLGVETSAARYVQFVDSDDTLAPQALERMLELAESSDADVVVGKLSSNFRGIHHQIFRTTVTGRTLDDFPLMQNLTACKMFRRDFLIAHQIRFPEGNHYIEDQRFCIEAYVHARSVAVVADTACYFYRRRRTGGGHFGDTTIVPRDYYRELEGIIDLLDASHVASDPRAQVLTRFARNEMLGRLRGPAMVGYDDGYRRDLVAEIRRLSLARFAPELRGRLPAMQRTQSGLLHSNDIGGLLNLAVTLESIRLRATTQPPFWRDGHLVLDIRASLYAGDEPFRFERVDVDEANQATAGWALPEAAAPGTSAEDRRLTAADVADLDLDLATISAIDSQLWSTTDGLTLDIDHSGQPRITGEVELDPATVMGGRPLTAGRWDLRLRAVIFGLSRTSPLSLAPDSGQCHAWVSAGETHLHSVVPVRFGRGLSLDVDESVESMSRVAAEFVDRAPTIDARRVLTVDASGLRGPAYDNANVTVILVPADDPSLGGVSSSAELRVRPDGSTILATLPPLPGSSGRWRVHLRIGPIGGSPPSRLPIDVIQDNSGQLRAVVARD